MSKQPDWDAYRYVLDDPTLDRAAFETRMLDDVDLALAVAEAVSHVDSLRAASFIAAPADLTVSSERTAGAKITGWRMSSLIALAAGLLLAIGLVNYQLLNRQVLNTHGQAGSLPPTSQANSLEQNLAESWLAIRQTEIVDGSSNLVDASTNFESPRDDENLLDAVDSVDEDWLMDAAREFYAQGEAG